MSTPRYVTQRVGDQYVLVRKDLPGQIGQSQALVGVAALFGLRGLFDRGPKRWVFMSVAATILGASYACSDGRCGQSERRRGRVKDLRRGPSYANDAISRSRGQKPEDDVDEASMESFPASDPPAVRVG